jgi:hypothetical protein
MSIQIRLKESALIFYSSQSSGNVTKADALVMIPDSVDRTEWRRFARRSIAYKFPPSPRQLVGGFFPIECQLFRSLSKVRHAALLGGD